MLSIIAAIALSLTPVQENLILTPLYFESQLVLHEGSHAVVGLLVGMKTQSFKPYPHFSNGFHFGETTFSNVATYNGSYIMETKTGAWKTAPAGKMVLWNAAPVITDLLMINGADLALSQVKNREVGLFLTVALMLVPWVDYTYNVNNRAVGSDLSDGCRAAGKSKTVVQIVGNVVALYDAWRIYRRLDQFAY